MFQVGRNRQEYPPKNQKLIFKNEKKIPGMNWKGLWDMGNVVLG